MRNGAIVCDEDTRGESIALKLASFRTGSRTSFGAALEDGFVDLGARFGEDYADLRSFLAKGGPTDRRVRELLEKGTADAGFDDVEFLPVIPNPDKILCVGLNYRDHVEETGRQQAEHPTVFIRLAGSQVGHRGPLLKPAVSDRLDFEGELAVVIGKAGRRIKAEEALSHVAGYACYNDASVRDWQRHTSQWGPGKNFMSTGAFGPWMVTSDDIDPTAKPLKLETRVNGEVMQRTTTDRMIFPIAEIIRYVSTFAMLQPGDVIVTGTPGGVGAARDPQRFLEPGDRVEVEIEGIGTLVNDVKAETV